MQAIEEFNADGSLKGGRKGPAGRWLETMTDIFIYWFDDDLLFSIDITEHASWSNIAMDNMLASDKDPEDQESK